jgi:hypothetical protein
MQSPRCRQRAGRRRLTTRCSAGRVQLRGRVAICGGCGGWCKPQTRRRRAWPNHRRPATCMPPRTIRHPHGPAFSLTLPSSNLTTSTPAAAFLPVVQRIWPPKSGGKMRPIGSEPVSHRTLAPSARSPSHECFYAGVY